MVSIVFKALYIEKMFEIDYVFLCCKKVTKKCSTSMLSVFLQVIVQTANQNY